MQGNASLEAAFCIVAICFIGKDIILWDQILIEIDLFTFSNECFLLRELSNLNLSGAACTAAGYAYYTELCFSCPKYESDFDVVK